MYCITQQQGSAGVFSYRYIHTGGSYTAKYIKITTVAAKYEDKQPKFEASFSFPATYPSLLRLATSTTAEIFPFSFPELFLDVVEFGFFLLVEQLLQFFLHHSQLCLLRIVPRPFQGNIV